MRALALAALLVAALLTVTGCGDSRPCLRGHHEIVPTYVMAGKVMVPINNNEFVCDEYAPKSASTP